ncbi:MAG: topoisomerase DNA-binding C4 zinc finger domain-containing protein, partial [Methanomethylophilus sp.]|nr:topoisomerase DNA-binding C4 zinc finger domain-containing protein [Methanomethylophilus sp.]
IGLLLDGGGSQMDEERRLFYVAMTRARETVYIVSVKDHQSVFFTEMFPRRGSGGYAVRMFCPICGGPLVLRTNSFGGRFYGCSNFGPKGCRYTRECGTGNSDHRTG